MKTRDSRIELLRIIACIMILAHHIIQHSGPTVNSLVYTHFSMNQLFSVLIGSWGQLGVTIFIIISSWYLLDKPGGGIRLSNVLNLVIQTWIICLCMTLVYVITNRQSLSMSLIVKELITPFYSEQYWFVTAYIVYYLTSPLLYKAINNLSIKMHKYICVVFTIAVPLYNFFFTNIGGALAYFYFIYICVALLKRKPENIIERHRIIIGLSSFVITIIGIIVCSIAVPLVPQMWRFQDCDNLFTFLIGISIFYSFLHFKRIDVKQINVLATRSLGVYLLTENFVVNGIYSNNVSVWNSCFKIGDSFNGSTLIFLGRVILTVLISYLLCAKIDGIRNWIHTTVLRKSERIGKLYKAIDMLMGEEEEN